jgi:dTMP kinase
MGGHTEERRGLLVVVDGLGGSGKTTAVQNSADMARKLGLTVTTVGYPRYTDSSLGLVIQDYLRGSFGPAQEVNPYAASLLYMVDRFEDRLNLEQKLRDYDVVILARYVSSNAAYQAAKLVSDRQAFIDWCFRMEYQVFGIPKEDVLIFLDLSWQHAQLRIVERSRQGGESCDGHESGDTFVQEVRDVYLELVNQHQQGHVISCNVGNRLLSQQEVATEICCVVCSALQQGGLKWQRQ